MQAAQIQTNPTAIPYVSQTQHKTRDDLLLLATNRFCDADSYTRLAADQFKEAFYLLVGDVSHGTKQIMARTVSRCAATPRPIALYLSLEPLTISAPILEYSSALGQLHLLQIIQMKGAEYAAVIAKRPDIGPSVIKRLRDFSESQVQENLNNNGALIDNETSRSAEMMFRQIKLTKIEAPIVKTAIAEDLPAQKPAVEQLSIEKRLLSAAARGGRLTTQPDSPKPQKSTTLDFAEVFEKAARSRSHQALAALIQKRFNVSLDTAFQVLADNTGDTLAVVMKAAELDDSTANRIQLLIHPNIGLSVQNAMRSIRFYAKLKTETCLIAINQWPTDNLDTSAAVHQPQLQDGRDNRTRTDTAAPTHSDMLENMERLAG